MIVYFRFTSGTERMGADLHLMVEFGGEVGRGTVCTRKIS